MMFQFAYPWLLIVLLAPLLVSRLGRPHRETRTALHVPFLTRLAQISGLEPSSGAVVLSRSRLQSIVLVFVWCSLVLALARPQHVGEPVTKTMPGRDLLIAVDLSGSMEAKDFTDSQGKRVDRVTAVKQVLDNFLSRRQGDRVGLIFFGSAPFLQVPFTEDLDVCRSLLKEAQAKMAGPKTMLGDAIGKAITIFDRSDLKEKVLIVLTDGNDTGSLVPPVKAAEIAHDKGITIHVVGMGDPTTVGEEQLDRETLDQIASKTGGKSYLAINRRELDQAYKEIDALNTRKVETLSHRPIYDLFFWPLLLAIGLTLLFHGWTAIRAVAAERKQLSRTANGEPKAAALAATLPLIGPVAWSTLNIGGLHLQRAEMLWLFVPAVLLIWAIIRRGKAERSWQRFFDANLLSALLISGERRRRIRPVYLLAAFWLLGIIALAGPAWHRETSPFAEEKAALVIALKVTPSMQTNDVQPSRLQRSVHKIHDVLALRTGARTALVAYAGSAHVVMPLTRDAKVIETFAAELAPDVMPKEGQDAAAAFKLAQKQLAESKLAGSILFVTDGISPADAARIKELQRSGGSRPVILGMIDATANAGERDSLKQWAGEMGASLEFVSPDQSDVNAIIKNVERNLAAATDSEGGRRWRDEGYWFIPLLCLMALVWFRPGWVVSWE
jgi:Ca-activated chloride channel homolog